jgi:lipopolysaccharide transport system permease protein
VDDADARGPGWVVNRSSAGWLPRLDLQGLWPYRELALLLALRDLRLRYKQTFFGIAWAVVQPLAAMAITSLLLGHLAGVPSDGIPYSAFVLSGLIVWFYVTAAVQSAAESLTSDRSLVTKVYFPRLVAPVAAVMPALVDLAVGLVVLVVVLAATSVTPGVAIVTLPLWIAAAVLVALGVGLWLSALNVLYRDVRYALPFALQLWLFASPVFFPGSLVTGGWRLVFNLNPMAGILQGFRWAVADGPAPVAAHLVSLASGVALLLGGLVFFRQMERRFADQI